MFSWNQFLMENSSVIKKADQHDFYLCFWHSYFYGLWKCRTFPFQTLVSWPGFCRLLIISDVDRAIAQAVSRRLSSSVSPEAGTIGHEWSQWQQAHKPNNNNSRRLPTAAAQVHTRVWSCEILWWTKVALGQVFSNKTSVYPANLHSICFSTIIFTITRGWHKRPGVAAVPIASQTR
jgi:hypothetical protein